MTVGEFQKFIDEQDEFFREIGKEGTERERILSRTVKISEELGELCDEVLASIGEQRKSKAAERDNETLSSEFADVVITTFLLAKCFDIDVMAALETKVEKIRQKHNKELT